MEFLTANWFSIACVLVYVAGQLINRARKDTKMDEMIQKIDSVANNFTAHERRFNEHVGDSDIHITPTLLELLKERHEYAKKEFADTRTDIQRVETLLNNMR
jgi:chorismate mutase